MVELVKDTSLLSQLPTALESILIEVHCSQVCVLERQRIDVKVGGWKALAGLSIRECVARSCPTGLQFQFSKGVCDRVHVRHVTYRAS